MKLLKKAGACILMRVPAAVMAGAYGAVHDQISYSFSSEYFTHFKFIRFSMPWAQDHPRSGAALVGVLATWWMGALAHVVLGAFAFMLPSPGLMIKELFRSFIVVMLVALTTGASGLIYGYFLITEATIMKYMHWVQPDVSDPVQFARVGFMHSASYLGGAIGSLAGVAYLLRARIRHGKAPESRASLAGAPQGGAL